MTGYAVKFKGRTTFHKSIKDARCKAYRLVFDNGKGVAYITKQDKESGNYYGQDIVVKAGMYPQVWFGQGNGTNAMITHKVNYDGNIENMSSQYDYHRSYPVAEYIRDGKIIYRRRN